MTLSIRFIKCRSQNSEQLLNINFYKQKHYLNIILRTYWNCFWNVNHNSSSL